MVRHDHGRGRGARIIRGGTRPDNGHAGGQASRPLRPLHRRRPVAGVGALGAAARAPCGPVPRRQLPPPADGALRRGSHQPGPPSPDELVAVSRPRLAAIPPLPESAVHAHGRRRHIRRPRHGLSMVSLPVAGPVADHRVLERPALRPEPLDGGVGRGGGAVPRLGGRHRLRAQGLRLGGLRRVDAAVGRLDTPAGVGLHLPGPVRAAGHIGLLRRPLHHADGGAALRDRVPGLRGARGVALHRPVGPLASARARRGARRSGGAGVGLGHRPRAPTVPLGGA